MSKEDQIIDYLQKQDSWITSQVLSNELGFSVRSIKKYISNINSLNPNAILSSRNGYMYNKGNSFHNEKKEISGSKQRSQYILKALLTEKKCSIFDLSEEIYISESTLRNDLNRLKKIIKPYGLRISTKNNTVFIDGDENDIKKLISSLIYSETQNSVMSLSLLDDYLPDFDIQRTKEIIQEETWKNHYYLDDFTLFSYVLHFGIEIQREKLNDEIIIKTENTAQPDPLTSSVYRRLNEEMGIYLPDYSLMSISEIILNRMHNDYYSENEKLNRLLDEICLKVEDFYGIHFRKEKLFERFGIHIKNLLSRMMDNHDIKNPQLFNIRNSYPFLYDLSVFIAGIIFQKTDLKPSDDEISFLALHVGLLLEEQQALQTRYQVVLVCTNYYDFKDSLSNKINSRFSDFIYINDVITTLDFSEKNLNCDFIISTDEIKESTIPVVKISYFLNDDDIQKISVMIHLLNKSTAYSDIKKFLNALLKKELFVLNPGYSDKNEAISDLCDLIIKADYADPLFKEKVLEREMISSSAFGRIAMPHPLQYFPNRSCIAIAISREPISWNGVNVNCIFLLAVAREDVTLFKDTFSYLIDTVSVPATFTRLLNISSYEEFTDLIL